MNVVVYNFETVPGEESVQLGLQLLSGLRPACWSNFLPSEGLCMDSIF
jgi:hypothetical protein